MTTKQSARLRRWSGEKSKPEIGQRFGLLSVVGDCGTRLVNGHFSRFVEVICGCGTSKVVLWGNLAAGRVKSCGCLRRDSIGARSLKHGETVGREWSAEYVVLTGMIQRCHNPKNASFRNYGGRGIEVCQRWRDDPGAFIADVGRKPSPKHELDRIDNDGNYEPGNCRWVTRQYQCWNTRRTRRVMVGGEEVALIEACRRAGISSAAVYQRIRAHGVSAQQAVDFYILRDTEEEGDVLRKWEIAA